MYKWGSAKTYDLVLYRITLLKRGDRRVIPSNLYMYGTIYVWDGTDHHPCLHEAINKGVAKSSPTNTISSPA